MKFSSPFAKNHILGASRCASLGLLLGLLLFAGVPQALAQEATIVGTVTDPTGAAVPHVAVTLTNTDTGEKHSIKTNESGEYVVPDLHIGHYKARAEGSGFSVAERTGLVLNVGDRLRVDFAMKMVAPRSTLRWKLPPWRCKPIPEK